jgi:hypothetical protein
VLARAGASAECEHSHDHQNRVASVHALDGSTGSGATLGVTGSRRSDTYSQQPSGMVLAPEGQRAYSFLVSRITTSVV